MMHGRDRLLTALRVREFRRLSGHLILARRLLLVICIVEECMPPGGHDDFASAVGASVFHWSIAGLK